MDIKEFLRKTTTLKRFIDGVVLQMRRNYVLTMQTVQKLALQLQKLDLQ